MSPSRRDTLQWMMAAAALPLVRWAPPAMAAGQGTPPPFDVVADWPALLPSPPPAPGYGRDPDLMSPKVPWMLTLSKAQRATVDLLGDLILPKDGRSPGAGALGVGAFIDEWISAPYPAQRQDRERVLGGLIWLDAQSRLLHGSTFGKINAAQRTSLLDALVVETPVSAMAKPVAFMDTLRYLFVLGFYSLPEGKADMGFIGDEPTPGDYPGPSAEALAHLAHVLQDLSLAAPQA
ncbi:gluconate 2-dehydrogenase subunit 3 family protein [Sphingomonas psychrotolerans]|uniref:Gluconate 2-dehydrogenase subunit 3 family protein n=1 Tax=Sphingomonas psychrotolerans TaxID=1327635 RepID=A0ABU3MY65_9SPHN|nr:gluconate 2-dehydrogenase subunit 3 family protein [Sphingomonas psychrotolerans]MDT8757255.1 gluconate 2-dehydrogenase subunit 3 family protein [Sphingomonas psychrotolerans]